MKNIDNSKIIEISTGYLCLYDSKNCTLKIDNRVFNGRVKPIFSIVTLRKKKNEK